MNDHEGCTVTYRLGFCNICSIWFGFQSQVLGFGFYIPPQCQSKLILVPENTKTEWIYVDGKFPSKYIDRPRQVWRGMVNFFTLGVISLSVDLSQQWALQ